MTYKFAALVFPLCLAGCATAPVPPSKLSKPASALMVAPELLPDLFEGDDIGHHAVIVRRMYGKEATKLRRLQRYVRSGFKQRASDQLDASIALLLNA